MHIRSQVLNVVLDNSMKFSLYEIFRIYLRTTNLELHKHIKKTQYILLKEYAVIRHTCMYLLHETIFYKANLQLVDFV